MYDLTILTDWRVVEGRAITGNVTNGFLCQDRSMVDPWFNFSRGERGLPVTKYAAHVFVFPSEEVYKREKERELHSQQSDSTMRESKIINTYIYMYICTVRN